VNGGSHSRDSVIGARMKTSSARLRELTALHVSCDLGAAQVERSSPHDPTVAERANELAASKFCAGSVELVRRDQGLDRKTRRRRGARVELE